MASKNRQRRGQPVEAGSEAEPGSGTESAVVDSVVGHLRITTGAGAVVGIEFAARERCRPPPSGRRGALLRKAIRQLMAYGAAKRREFDLPLRPVGTAFQREVWAEVARIPSGEVSTYAEIARRIGNPRAVRATGAANGRNPLPILIPCHRVVGSDGRLTGYGGGLRAKRRLLELEGLEIKQGRLAP